jgi:hypothetical protein
VRPRTIIFTALILFVAVGVARAQSSVALGAYPAWAQTGGSLSGVVTDQTGAALPNVAVTIKSLDSAETRTITTDIRPASGALPDSRGKTRVCR